MNITYYVYGPLMLVTAGTTTLSSMGYNIKCAKALKPPSLGEPIFDVVDIIRKIKAEIPTGSGLTIELNIID